MSRISFKTVPQSFNRSSSLSLLAARATLGPVGWRITMTPSRYAIRFFISVSLGGDRKHSSTLARFVRQMITSPVPTHWLPRHISLSYPEFSVVIQDGEPY